MSTHFEPLEIRTEGKGTYEITDQVAAAVVESGVKTGTATVFVQHTSASLVIFENADRSARVDLEEYFERLVPEDTDYFTHTSEGPDDSTSHIRMVLTRSSEVIPIAGGTAPARHVAGNFPVRAPPLPSPATRHRYRPRRIAAPNAFIG